MTLKQKRKHFMDFISGMYDILDPSGENTKLFHEKWDKFSDDEFKRNVEAFFKNPKAQFYLEIVELERDLTMDNALKCLDYLGVPFCEYVAVPHINGDLDNIVITPEPVPVGYIHLRRLQQTVLKKNTGSISIKKRDPKTGQVTGEDKNARNSNVETYSLLASNSKAALKEFMGPRADDMKAKNQMYNKLSKDGFVSLADLDNDQRNKIAINSLDVYFTMQGLRTNLVYPLNVIPYAN